MHGTCEHHGPQAGSSSRLVAAAIARSSSEGQPLVGLDCQPSLPRGAEELFCDSLRTQDLTGSSEAPPMCSAELAHAHPPDMSVPETDPLLGRPPDRSRSLIQDRDKLYPTLRDPRLPLLARFPGEASTTTLSTVCVHNVGEIRAVWNRQASWESLGTAYTQQRRRWRQPPTTRLPPTIRILAADRRTPTEGGLHEATCHPSSS